MGNVCFDHISPYFDTVLNPWDNRDTIVIDVSWCVPHLVLVLTNYVTFDSLLSSVFTTASRR